MRTDTNVADGDTPLPGAGMKGQFDRNLFVLDRTRVADGFLFATHGDRARYLGQSQREKPLWLKQNEGRFRRLNDIKLESFRRAPAVESETKVAAAIAGPNGETSSPDVRKDGDHEDVASIDTLPRDCSPPYQPTTLPTPVKAKGPNGSTQTELLPYAEAATREAVGSQTESTPAGAIDGIRDRSGGGQRKKQKPPAGTSKAGPKRSPELMLLVLNSLAEVPIRWHAASQAGIHRKTLEYWIRCSAAGHDGYDIEWQDVTLRFHELCKFAVDEAHQKLLDLMLERAFFGYDKVLTYRGRVMYKIDQGLVDRGYEGPDAYLRDENGTPIPETVRKVDMKATRFWLARHRPEKWGRHREVNAPRAGGVLVVGDVTKKPKYNTAASVQARTWKAGSRMIQDAKD
jgi:hypothetical protein